MSKFLLVATALALLFGAAAAQGSLFPDRNAADDFCYGYAICQ